MKEWLQKTAFYYTSCPTHIKCNQYHHQRGERTAIQNYMNFLLLTELTEHSSCPLHSLIRKYSLTDKLASWIQHTGLWYKTTPKFNAKWELIKENYRIIGQVNVYKGNLCQTSDVTDKLPAAAEAKQSRQKDALRRQQWLGTHLVPLSPPNTLSMWGTGRAQGSRESWAGVCRRTQRASAYCPAGATLLWAQQ